MSTDKSDPILPDTPPTTPTLESMQAKEQPKTAIHRLAMASAAAMINQIQKMAPAPTIPAPDIKK